MLALLVYRFVPLRLDQHATVLVISAMSALLGAFNLLHATEENRSVKLSHEAVSLLSASGHHVVSMAAWDLPTRSACP